MERKLVFKRVENPEGWESVYGCQVGYICTNIRRDVIAWFGDCLDEQTSDECIDRFIRYGNDPALVCRDREGNKVPAPTPDEIIWPRFTAVEVEGGWSVLDQWENERHKNVGTRENTETTLRMLADGRLTKQQGSGWIPYVPPAPKEPTPRYIEIDVEGGKAVYDTVTKQRRDVVYFSGEERVLRNSLKCWNDGDYGEPGDEPNMKWIPHEPPAPGAPQYIACQHQGKWGGGWSENHWGIRRVADDAWTDCPHQDSAEHWAGRLSAGEKESPDWRWYPRKVDDHKQPESETQEALTLTGDSQADMVFSPLHYTAGDIECIDAIRAALGDEGFIAFCRGVVIKYHWRAKLKGDTQNDLGKAAFYSQMAAHVADPLMFKDPREKV